MDATIHIDDQLSIRVQEVAQATGQTVDTVISNALAETLESPQKPSSGKKIHLIRDKEMGLKPGVNINNNAELLDIMEEG
jgi:predicted transcriptional regulator